MSRRTAVFSTFVAALVGTALISVSCGRQSITAGTVQERIRAEVRPGASIAEVKSWLAATTFSQGHRPAVLEVHEKRTMELIGEDSVAKLAGIDESAVATLLRLTVVDAHTDFFETTDIVAYFFFDADGRLIGHWVTERVTGL